MPKLLYSLIKGSEDSSDALLIMENSSNIFVKFFDNLLINLLPSIDKITQLEYPKLSI